MAAQRVTLFPFSTSVYFHANVWTGSTVLGQASYAQQIQQWQADIPYQQKVDYDQELCIMVHTQYSASADPTLKILDHNLNEITAIILPLNDAPFYKGKQVFPNNNYTMGGATIPLLSSLWVFSFADFASAIPNGGIFYLQLTNFYTGEPDVISISEPLFVSDSHRNVNRYQFTYNSNKSGNTNVIVQNWWNDYPTNKDPYNPVFTLVTEGYIIPDQFKVINIGYLQQSYRQLQVKTEQSTTFKLSVGEVSLGIPYYLLQKLTAALLADNLFIDEQAYIVFNPNSQTSLSDLWKIRAADEKPLLYASTTVMFVSESQFALLSPPDDPFKIFDDTFDDTFA